MVVVEEVVDEVTEETPVVAGDPTIDEAVDELFARIRAGRADEVANAEEVLADEPRLILLARRSSGQPDAKETSEETGETDVFEQRSAALAPLQTSLARKLRRVLADEQNEVLDRLRQGSKLPDARRPGRAPAGARRPGMPGPPEATSTAQPVPARRSSAACPSRSLPTLTMW